MIRRLRRLRQESAGSLSVVGLLILEFAAILAAVVLGFMVNEWREVRGRDRVVEAALTGLAREMSQNHRQIVETYAYHTRILEIIREHLAPGRGAAAGGAPVYLYELAGHEWRGARTAMLRSASWQMLVSTGTIGHLPYEAADALAQVYTVQAMLEKLDDAIYVTFAHDPGFTRVETIHHMFEVYAELMPSLIGVYQEEGRPILARYGYDLGIDHEPLRLEVERQMATYPRR
jgi:hypothetical protein